MSNRLFTVGVDQRIFVYELNSEKSDENFECVSSIVTNVGDPAGLLSIKAENPAGLLSIKVENPDGLLPIKAENGVGLLPIKVGDPAGLLPIKVENPDSLLPINDEILVFGIGVQSFQIKSKWMNKNFE